MLHRGCSERLDFYHTFEPDFGRFLLASKGAAYRGGVSRVSGKRLWPTALALGAERSVETKRRQARQKAVFRASYVAPKGLGMVAVMASHG